MLIHAKQPADVLIVGDSITLGASEVRGSEVLSRVPICYVEHLRELLPRVRFVADAHVNRNTTSALTALDALLAAHDADVVLLMLGGNDADMDWKRFILSSGRVIRNNVTVEKYGTNLRQLVARVEACGARAVLTDMPNHDLSLRGPYFSKLSNTDVTAMIDAGGGQVESDRRWHEYRKALAAVAAETGAECVEYGLALSRHPSSVTVGHDTMHPSAEAHRLIAQSIAPVLARACAAAGRAAPTLA